MPNDLLSHGTRLWRKKIGCACKNRVWGTKMNAKETDQWACNINTVEATDWPSGTFLNHLGIFLERGFGNRFVLVGKFPSSFRIG